MSLSGRYTQEQHFNLSQASNRLAHMRLLYNQPPDRRGQVTYLASTDSLHVGDPTILSRGKLFGLVIHRVLFKNRQSNLIKKLIQLTLVKAEGPDSMAQVLVKALWQLARVHVEANKSNSK